MLLDALFAHRADARVFALDTLVLFPETYSLLEQTEARYGITVERATGPTLEEQAAAHGDRLWERDPDACCGAAQADAAARQARRPRRLDHRHPARAVTGAGERAQGRVGRQARPLEDQPDRRLDARRTSGAASTSARCPTTRCTTRATRRSAARTARVPAPAARDAGRAATRSSAGSTPERQRRVSARSKSSIERSSCSIVASSTRAHARLAVEPALISAWRLPVAAASSATRRVRLSRSSARRSKAGISRAGAVGRPPAGRGAGDRRGGAPAGRAEERHLRRDVGGERHEVRRSRRARSRARSGSSSSAPGSSSPGGRSTWRSSRSTSAAWRAQHAVGRAGRASSARPARPGDGAHEAADDLAEDQRRLGRGRVDADAQARDVDALADHVDRDDPAGRASRVNACELVVRARLGVQRRRSGASPVTSRSTLAIARACSPSAATTSPPASRWPPARTSLEALVRLGAGSAAARPASSVEIAVR